MLKKSGLPVHRSDSFAEAVMAAETDTGVLLLADDYPDRQTHVDRKALERALSKHLRLYLEYPDKLPGHVLDPPTDVTWERAVVTTSPIHQTLSPLTILSVSACRFLPTTATNCLLSIARVAGYDHAIYGLPPGAHPLLFELPEYNALIATTGLSRFVRARYSPVAEWESLWGDILAHVAGFPFPALHSHPEVQPAFPKTAAMPHDFQRNAVRLSAEWLLNSRLLLDKERSRIVRRQLATDAEVTTIPVSFSEGDGSLGILEGYSSAIHADGSQSQRLPVRADCQAESAMLLAASGNITHSARQLTVARNLLRFLYDTPDFYSAGRADTTHSAYGLIAWGAYSPGWEVANYGDDNARVILGSLAAVASLNDSRWDTQLLRAIAANFRTTGRSGFRGDRIDMPEFAQHDWHHFANRELVNLAPSFESWLWACYLFAYEQTKYQPFIDRTREGITRTMAGYPSEWRLKDNSERARMLLCLAWLIRVDDTAQHREWLDRVAADLLLNMDPCGAISEHLVGAGGGHYQVPQSNEAYGKGECPLLQENGDPVTDQLYTSGFALLGLHEAAAVTTGSCIAEAENKLANYLCRVQVCSRAIPYLDGAWLRGFDFQKWDYWANSCDAGWGPWCAETGWGHTWIGTTLALRERRQSLWQLLISRPLKSNWPEIQRAMFVAVP